MRDLSPSADRMALAWGLAWLLAPMAVVMAAGSGPIGSTAYSNPEKAAVVARVSLVAGYALSIASWATAAIATAAYLARTFGADTRVIMRSAVGWALGWIAAMPLAVSWARTWDAGFVAFFLSLGVAGAIGGAMTLPVATLTVPPLTLLRMTAVNGLGWGGTFLVLSFFGFFAGYIFAGLFPDELFPAGGWIIVAGILMPFAAAGFAAARVGQGLLEHGARYRPDPTRHPS